MSYSQKVIIDADPGIGDAVALALALHDPDLDVLGVTATAGCVAGRQATRNVQAVVDSVDPPRLPRVGSTSMLEAVRLGPERGFVNPLMISGRTGLGDAEFQVAELHHEHESAKLMVDIARAHPNEVTLLTLGPLTNVELACERAPEFLGLLKGLVCFGGSVTKGGDVTAAAEFNIYANPIAARNVLCSPATKTLVPLDVSGQAVLTFQQFDRHIESNDSPLGRFLGNLLPFAFRAHHEHLGLEGVLLHEVTALAAVARPRFFQRSEMALDVETAGELTRGATVFDRRVVERWQSNIDVLVDVDAQGVLDYFTGILQRAAG